jgi:hypothetical protein
MLETAAEIQKAKQPGDSAVRLPERERVRKE